MVFWLGLPFSALGVFTLIRELRLSRLTAAVWTLLFVLTPTIFYHSVTLKPSLWVATFVSGTGFWLLRAYQAPDGRAGRWASLACLPRRASMPTPPPWRCGHPCCWRCCCGRKAAPGWPRSASPRHPWRAWRLGYWAAAWLSPSLATYQRGIHLGRRRSGRFITRPLAFTNSTRMRYASRSSSSNCHRSTLGACVSKCSGGETNSSISRRRPAAVSGRPLALAWPLFI